MGTEIVILRGAAVKRVEQRFQQSGRVIAVPPFSILVFHDMGGDGIHHLHVLRCVTDNIHEHRDQVLRTHRAMGNALAGDGMNPVLCPLVYEHALLDEWKSGIL